MTEIKQVTKLEYIYDFNYLDCSVRDLVTKLEGYIQEHGEDVIIHSECAGYDGPDEYYLLFKRDENLEEGKARLEEERKECERKIKRKIKKDEKDRKEKEEFDKKEIKEYKRLQKKFG